MSTAVPAVRRLQLDAPKYAVNSALKARLCAVELNGPRAVAHVGALLAFTPSAARSGGSMVFNFTHAASAQYAVNALGAADAKLIKTGIDSARVFVFNAPTVLSRFGFHDGHWRFSSSVSDAGAISLGALHGGGWLSRQGLKVPCSTSGLLLTLMAVLARLDVVARPTMEPVALTVGRRLVPGFLNQLGLDDIADQYAQFVWPTAVGGRS